MKFFLSALFFCIYLQGIGARHLSVLFTETKDAFPATKATIYYDAKDAKVVKIAAEAFSNDIKLISGNALSLSQSVPKGICIIVGTIGHSTMIDDFVKKGDLDISSIVNSKERFIIKTIVGKSRKLLVIAGSDRRGTAYGVFHLSGLMGVSPFVWWADVLPEQHQSIFVSGEYTSKSPSVEYRGIFINDEDWGLQPWAAKHCDTDIKDIGPKTYAKIFELLLRLKANFIWPAMHPCTKAFYYYKENPKVADDYAIVVGGSHCEPLLRNNVFEWSENFEHEYGHKPGEWRYDLNRNEIYKYWNDRVKESVNYESVFTVGMRGVHDGSMPGPKDIMAKKTLLEKVIEDQREILSHNFNKPADRIPQIFVPYKEVLSIYQKGMKLPDDVTIIWPDDNHGYIRQLPNEEEQKRSGGHGVYYHLSYWGAPADYLWLSSISPALISYEMNKAYSYGAKRLWVFNVGDIKPAETELQYCMDMAWDIDKCSPENTRSYLQQWAASVFGRETANEIASIKLEYYNLAASAKPEHLNAVNFTKAEAMKRLTRYAALARKTDSLQTAMPSRLKNAYNELIWYPVHGAMLMNEKILLALESRLVSTTDHSRSLLLAKQARQAFDSIRIITDYYNREIANGKWNGIMSWHPRNQKVFEMPPVVSDSTIQAKTDWLPQPELIIEAEQLARPVHGTLRQHCLIEGLGICEKGLVTCDSSNIEYPLLLQPGNYRIVVKWLPTFDVSEKKQLNYTIAIDKEQKQTVNIHADADTGIWKENVLNGYSKGETQHTITASKSILTLKPLNNNMVLSRIEIYKN
jgi:Glycosyl hydrolase family 67 N-terminus.